MRKKISAFFLAVIMLVSVTGCGKEEEPLPPQETPPVSQQEQETPQSPEQPQDAEWQQPTFQPQIKEAREKNEDIVGWLKIDDLKIDGAVVQAENNKRYERQNEWKQYSWTGSYFADYECNLTGREQLSKNTVIYGHNVHFDDNKDGERFSQLFHFTDIDFAKEHPYLYFSTYDPAASQDGKTLSENDMVWQIFSVFYTTTDFNYIQITKDFQNPDSGEITDAQLMNIITEAQKRSEYVYDVPVTAKDKILTLSTCSYRYGKRDDVRFVVMAKLLAPGEAPQMEVSITENLSKKTVE